MTSPPHPFHSSDVCWHHSPRSSTGWLVPCDLWRSAGEAIKQVVKGGHPTRVRTNTCDPVWKTDCGRRITRQSHALWLIKVYLCVCASHYLPSHRLLPRCPSVTPRKLTRHLKRLQPSCVCVCVSLFIASLPVKQSHRHQIFPNKSKK